MHCEDLPEGGSIRESELASDDDCGGAGDENVIRWFATKSALAPDTATGANNLSDATYLLYLRDKCKMQKRVCINCK